MLSAQNKVRYRAWVYLGTFILDVALTLVLAHDWGALGAGIAYAVSCFIGFGLVGNVMLSKQLGITLKDFLVQAFLPMLLPTISVLLMGLLLTLLPLVGWIAFLLKAVVLVIGYLVPLWFFVFNKKEKERFYVIVDGWNAKTRSYFHDHLIATK